MQSVNSPMLKQRSRTKLLCAAAALSMWMANQVDAQTLWQHVGYLTDHKSNFYFDKTSLDKTPDGSIIAATLVVFDEMVYDEAKNYNVLSIVEINLHDCRQDLIFFIRSEFYSTRRPRRESFLDSFTPDEILGFSPDHSLLIARHPTHDHLCAR